ncbi:CFEM domain-containing protein [Pleurotus pulmonarius]
MRLLSAVGVVVPRPTSASLPSLITELRGSALLVMYLGPISVLYVFVIVLSVVHGQVTNTLPRCAANCTTTAAEAAGCSLTDVNCLCNSEGFLSAAQLCAFQACSGTDQAAAAVAFARLCNNVPPISVSSVSVTPVPSSLPAPTFTTLPASTLLTVTTIISTLSQPLTTVTLVSTLPSQSSLASSDVPPTTTTEITTSLPTSTSTLTPLPSTTPQRTTTTLVVVTASPTPDAPTTGNNSATSQGQHLMFSSCLSLLLSVWLFS